ncbi:hypothetical protein BX600DRAFT_439298 [Xylariales sp. PMI_506]|nr:hypothetical protein BX600DRAFT_439298 [Xylariales sp. PMI_506]
MAHFLPLGEKMRYLPLRQDDLQIQLHTKEESIVPLFAVYDNWKGPRQTDYSFTERCKHQTNNQYSLFIPSREILMIVVSDLHLQDYNQTVHFSENIAEMRKSENSTKFWNDLEATSGIVAVPTEWALSLGFAPSLASPEIDGHSIYQVDMYHSLHCLYHVRNRLISKLPLDAWPRDDVHSLHCIDFLRQQVLCHGDVTLQGTDDFLHFSKNPGHSCRDTNAIRGWVEERNWAGHAKWIENMYGVV